MYYLQEICAEDRPCEQIIFFFFFFFLNLWQGSFREPQPIRKHVEKHGLFQKSYKTIQKNIFKVHCLPFYLRGTSQPAHYCDFSPFNTHPLKLMSY